jgi:hypothetical protein
MEVLLSMGAASAIPGWKCGGHRAFLQVVGVQDFRVAVPEAGDSREGVSEVIPEEVAEGEHDILFLKHFGSWTNQWD